MTRIRQNKRVLLLSVLAVLLSMIVLLLAGCSVGEEPDPTFKNVTLPVSTDLPTDAVNTPPESETATPDPEATGTDVPTDIPTETPTSEPTATPEPTAEPTERPDTETLKFKEYIEQDKGNLRSLCIISADSPEGYRDHVLANIFDNDEHSYWSYLNSTLDVQLTLEFSTPVYIAQLDNWWYTLNKVYYYELAVKYAGSDEFETVLDRSKNTSADETQDNLNAGPIVAVRYTFFDNSMLNKWVQLAEVYIKGFAFSSELYEIDHANKIIYIPEATDAGGFIESLKFTGKCKASIGFMPGETGTVTDASIFRITYNKYLTADYEIRYKALAPQPTEAPATEMPATEAPATVEPTSEVQATAEPETTTDEPAATDQSGPIELPDDYF